MKTFIVINNCCEYMSSRLCDTGVTDTLLCVSYAGIT